LVSKVIFGWGRLEQGVMIFQIGACIYLDRSRSCVVTGVDYLAIVFTGPWIMVKKRG